MKLDQLFSLAGKTLLTSIDDASLSVIIQKTLIDAGAKLTEKSTADILILDTRNIAMMQTASESMTKRGGSIIVIGKLNEISAAIAGPLAVQLAAKNLRINRLLLGPIEQPALADKTCLRRAGTYDELQGPLLFLASEASSYMTGQSITVDGGQSVL
ncbi:MAG TPA: SDR family oxidoreductase [Candidatus Peribacteraceae bacterium]|nr:SDR family oxidoreductase [Candidatus Peribacteraceae bacterium]